MARPPEARTRVPEPLGGKRSGGWLRPGELAVANDVSVLELADRTPIAHGRDLHPRDSIRASYDGQDHDALLRLVPDFAVQPRPRLDLIRLSAGYVHFGAGGDGIVLTPEGAVVRETARFSGGLSLPGPEVFRRTAREIDADWVTVVDCAWHNHFHLLTLAMPKLYLARQHRPEARVVVPASRTPNPGAPSDALARMLGLGGFGPDVGRIPDGLYRVRDLHLVWSNYDRGAFLHFFDEVFAHLKTLGDAAGGASASPSPQRLFILRPHDPRIAGYEGLRFLYDHLERAGFIGVQLETLSLDQQVLLFRNATHVVAAHGAGLSNIVFGNPRLRVLEINVDLDGQGYLRPWFLLLASGRRLHYQYLNVSAGQFTEARIAQAFDRFLAPEMEAEDRFGAPNSLPIHATG